jgi:UDP-GlcNAc3NAcA epimerase
MIKILTVVGARPQIIKAAAISRAIKEHYSHRIQEIIVHTGQHYDAGMSQVFFDELGVPSENYNLHVGSGSHGVQTAAMLTGIEEILIKEKPECLVVYGDTNSTLAGAVAASKLHIPIVHVEGGVRSYNKKFPEEVNRLVCDHLSTLIFVPTLSGMESLEKEGFPKGNIGPYHASNPKIYHCGDIMYDNSLFFSEKAGTTSAILNNLGLKDKRFALVTLHRPDNVDKPETLMNIVTAVHELSLETGITMVVPLHPRTSKVLDSIENHFFKNTIERNKLLQIIPAVSFLDMINLEKTAEIILTDSGGVQKEAYYFEKPCVIILEETPWVELVESQTAILTGSDPQKIKDAFRTLISGTRKLHFPKIFGDGRASYFICEMILESFGTAKP